ncbi:MAG: DUF3310 domain-containing protein [candidate division Zixibacteria bacterium]|nr:DUF3310 domain-containing protein [candidate division Zixibacteria bacterium]
MSVDKKADYYDVGGIEVIDIIQAKLSEEGFSGYLQGNIIKYSCRAGHKPGNFSRDIEKITTYSKLLTEVIENNENSRSDN